MTALAAPSWSCMQPPAEVADRQRTYDRLSKVWCLRKSGAHFTEIGAALGMSPTRARQMFLRFDELKRRGVCSPIEEWLEKARQPESLATEFGEPVAKPSHRRPPPRHAREAAETLRAAGWALEKIAAALKLSVSLVGRWLKIEPARKDASEVFRRYRIERPKMVRTNAALAAPIAVRWLIDKEPDVYKAVAQFVMGESDVAYIDVAGPPLPQDKARAIRFGERSVPLPVVRLNMRHVKHNLTGEMGVEVTCSDPDLAELARWQTLAMLKGASVN